MDAKEIAEKLSEEERRALREVVGVRLVSPRSHIPGRLQECRLVLPVWRRGETFETSESGYEATPLGREVAALLSPPLMSG